MEAKPTKVPIGSGFIFFVAGALMGLLSLGFALTDLSLSALQKPGTNRELATRRAPAAPTPAARTTTEVPIPEAEDEPAASEPVSTGQLFDPLERAKPIIDIEGVPPEDLEGVPVPRSLNPNAATLQSIQAQVGDAQPLMDACYEAARKTNPGLSGLSTLSIALSPADDGTTLVEATAEGRDMQDSAFEECLVYVVTSQDYGTVSRTIRVSRRTNYAPE